MNAPVRTPVVLSDDQYEDMTRKGAFVHVGRVELRGGVIVQMSPVHYPHGRVASELFLLLHKSVAAAGLALKETFEVTVRFGGGFQPTADIVVWDPALAPASFDGPIPGDAVRIVVEVADASLADDLGAKLADYAKAGLAEYWVADVRARVIFQHAQPNETGYATRAVHPFGAKIAALTLPLAIATDTL
jgi:Uma2 family endonuclease